MAIIQIPSKVQSRTYYWPLQGGASFVDPFCYLCFVSVIMSCLFIAALWSTAGEMYVMFSCVFVTFPCGVLGKVWYLIVSIPDLCLLSYYVQNENCTWSSKVYICIFYHINHLLNVSLKRKEDTSIIIQHMTTDRKESRSHLYMLRQNVG